MGGYGYLQHLETNKRQALGGVGGLSQVADARNAQYQQAKAQNRGNLISGLVTTGFSLATGNPMGVAGGAAQIAGSLF